MPAHAEQTPDPPERLVFFTDAVVAIALTLLAIDLPVPSAESDHAFFTSIRDNQGHYLAFLLSFVVVAAAWRNHKRMHVLVTVSDTTFETLNFAWLLTVVLLPFAAKLLTLQRHPPAIVHACCFGAYALLEAISSAIIIVMLRHARANGQIEADKKSQLTELQRNCLGLVAGFGLSIPLFFATPSAWALWILGPVLVDIANRVVNRRALTTPLPEE
jgi:uncharacterized membrane protein